MRTRLWNDAQGIRVDIYIDSLNTTFLLDDEQIKTLARGETVHLEKEDEGRLIAADYTPTAQGALMMDRRWRQLQVLRAARK